MTDTELRDHFAGLAMQALIASVQDQLVTAGVQCSADIMRGLEASVAKGAYNYADAMMNERAKTK